MSYLKLDVYQENAVKSVERNLLVVAPPGSGKTTVILDRIKYLTTFKKVSPDEMKVITFTRAGAINMRERYNKLSQESSTPFFGTFHSLFLKILKNETHKLSLISELEKIKIINGVLYSYINSCNEEKVIEILNNISSFKNSNKSMCDFEPKIDRAIFKQCYSVYEQYMLENNKIDFDDIQIKFYNMFKAGSGLIEKYRNQFKYILVDEFQDCDELQINILRLLTTGNSIFAVGDEDQCIYGFRGSRPDCMVDFDKYFENGKKVFLCINYRSPKNIISISDNIIKNNVIRNDKKFIANKDYTRKIKVFSCIDEKTQAESISSLIINDSLNENFKYANYAILYRTNYESRIIADILFENKIPFKMLDEKFNFFKHSICKDLIAYYKLCLDPCDKESFIRIINKPFRYISRLNLEKFKNISVKEDCFDIIKDINSVPVYQIKELEKLRKRVKKLKKFNFNKSVDYILKRLGYKRYLINCKKTLKMENVDFEDIIIEFKSSINSCIDISSFIEKVIKFGDNTEIKNEEAVILSTIHGVKGMEFKNVSIVNCIEDVMPHSNSIEKYLEEERRLFFVAVTRTIEDLNIFVPQNYRRKKTEQSRFIVEAGLKINEIISYT